MLDRFPIEVREVAQIAGLPDRTVRVGAAEGFYADLRMLDDDGRELRGLRAFEVDAPEFVRVELPAYEAAIDVVNDPNAAVGWPRQREYMGLTTDQSERDGTVTLRAGDRSWRVEVHAAAPAVESVSLSARPNQERAQVEAAFSLANPRERVLACCEWRVEPEDAGVSLNDATCDAVRAFNAAPEAPREADVVCVAGGVEGRTTVTLSAGS